MNANPANPARFTTLVYWMREREKIRALKEAGRPRPWTDDAILREWRFCNVNRCDDTVTRWIFANIIEPHFWSPSLWFNLVIARLVNWPLTLEALGYFEEWDIVRFMSVMGSRTGKVWTGAYMIPAGPSGVGKAEFIASQPLTTLWNARAAAPTSALATCASWFAFIEKAPALGGFLSNQVVTDMKYTAALELAPDRETFIVAGRQAWRGEAP